MYDVNADVGVRAGRRARKARMELEEYMVRQTVVLLPVVANNIPMVHRLLGAYLDSQTRVCLVENREISNVDTLE